VDNFLGLEDFGGWEGVDWGVQNQFSGVRGGGVRCGKRGGKLEDTIGKNVVAMKKIG
jgi:hypothetical protein